MPYFDEKETANKILLDGFKGELPSYFEMLALAKHFRSNGQGSKRIKKNLIETCKSFSPDFSEVIFNDELDSIIRKALKNDFKTIPSVSIFEEEVNLIRQFKDFKVQRILFTFLVYAKSFPEYGYNTISVMEWLLKNIMVQSGTKVTYYQFLLKYKTPIEELGLMEYRIRRTRKSVKASYILKYAREVGKEIYRIDTPDKFENCSKIYKEEIVGGELFWCVDCGVEGIKESNRQKRCNLCRAVEKREKVRRHRNKMM